MRKSLIVLLVLLALTVIGLELAGRMIKKQVESGRGQQGARVPEKKLRPSRVGEKIVYDVKLGGLKLGESVFVQLEDTLFKGRQANLFIFETKLMRFSDTERIIGDPQSHLPLHVERRVRVWPKREEIVEDYDQQAFSVRLDKNGKKEEIKSDGPLQNAILLPFALRECRLEAGWEAKVNLPTQKFTVAYAGKEKVRVPAGEFEAYYFKSEPEKFEVWVTADESRIPVKIKGNAFGYTMHMSAYTPPPGARKEAQK